MTAPDAPAPPAGRGAPDTPAPAAGRPAPGGSGPAPGGWPDLDGLPGVPELVERARSAVIAVRQLPANRRGWARTGAAASVRAARASAVLEGGSAAFADPRAGAQAAAGPGDGMPGDGMLGAATSVGDLGAAAPQTLTVTDPVLAGALRVAAEIGQLATVWRRAPLQALARLHTLAAADLVDADRLGRPRSEPGVGARLASLAQVVTQAPWSGPVTVAVVHGELLALRPFGVADGVVARAAARLTMIATGLDPQGLTVPEVGHLRAGSGYPLAAAGFAAGDRDGLQRWIDHVCTALLAGAREARSIAAAAG
ncbi:MAG TPA: oxidoreductase [Nakamurella sp.]|nr:oxidoreductase [Nakamurella sp.]